MSLPRLISPPTQTPPPLPPLERQFEELDFQNTPIGELSLRRKKVLKLNGQEVYEVKINEGFLMSSLFPFVEEEMAVQGLALCPNDEPLDVVVGGLGLGHTAVKALENPRVRSLYVVEYIEAVIQWHCRGLVPLAPTLCQDPRCHFVHGDFFALAMDPDKSFAPEAPAKKFHAILLDIDHTPELILRDPHGGFYQEAGLRAMTRHLLPGGVFAMWSDGTVNEPFLQELQKVFPNARAERVTFPNPLQHKESANTLYLASKA
ncbi:MAG: hypothetical protein LAT58_11710 [Opitutales bacterium]|nr:hypothetical protein [Opitutales bacterium]